MKKFIFLFLSTIIVTTQSRAAPSPTYSCRSYQVEGAVRMAITNYIRIYPHRVSGYLFYDYDQYEQNGQALCRITFSRNTNSCDENLYRSISVNPKTNRIAGDMYYASSWCGY